MKALYSYTLLLIQGCHGLLSFDRVDIVIRLGLYTTYLRRLSTARKSSAEMISSFPESP